MTRGTTFAAALVAAAFSAICVPRDASADRETLARTTTALERGAYAEALRDLEYLADHGFTHPDASFNRAVAYSMRARSAQGKPGDLGQALAALAETLLARPGDSEALAALHAVQGEIARGRARHGKEPVTARPSIDRALVGLASENVWSSLALAGSVALALGLVVLRFGRAASHRLAGSVIAWIAGIALAAAGTLAWRASHLRRTTAPAVVIVDEARLLDDQGAPTKKRDGAPIVSIPEGAEVEVRGRTGALSLVRWGTTEGFVRPSEVRLLARP